MQRRQAIKTLSTICASSLVLHRLPGLSPPAKDTELSYGLFFGIEDLPRIRTNFISDPLFEEFRNELEAFDKKAEYAFMENDLRYNDQLYDIGRLGNTAEAMAFLYLMTGDKEAAKLAIRAIREILKFERWDFFLEGNESIAVQRGSSSTIAVALAADFLGNQISSKERREWIRVMGERGCKACYLTLYGIQNPQDVVGWRFDPESTFLEHRPTAHTDMNRRPEISWDINLRAVPASAMVIGAVAYQLEMGESPLTSKWIEMGKNSTEVFQTIFEPDGSYHEEVGYAYYTAQHLQQTVVTMSRQGVDSPDDLVNWDGFIDYLVNTTMPTHHDPYTIVNWGDSGKRPENSRKVTQTALPLWIAAKTGNPLAMWYAENFGGKHTFWSVIWHKAAVKAQPPEQGPRLWISDIDRVVARTGFTVDDLVVAMRSGPPGNHEHADRNSIIIKCYGEQLVADPLRPPYGFADPSWPMRLTEGHSAVLVDGRGHEHHNGAEGTNASRSYARITHQDSSPLHAQWTSNATQPYRLVDLDIKEVIRTVVVLYDEPAIIVVDRFKKFKNSSSFTARFFGYNLDGSLEQNILPDGFLVSRPHATLRATTYASSDSKILKGNLNISPDDAKAHPYIDITTEPATEGLLVTVLSLGRTQAQTHKATIKPDKDGLDVAIGSSRIRITPSGSSGPLPR